MNKPTLINIYSPQIEDGRFFNSLIPFKDTFDHMQICLPTYPGNVERFFLIPEVLDDTTWYIFTDTTDVVMQSPLPDLSGVKADIIVADENEIHGNSFWSPYLSQIFRPLTRKTIYNAGCFAMKGKMLKKFIAYLKHIYEMVPSPFVDQLCLNMFCHELHPDKVKVDGALFATLYANMDKGIIFKVGDIWRNSENNIITFIHGNGSTKRYL